MKSYTVTINSSQTSFQVKPGESVLDAALRQGVMLPYSCKNGTCGSCKGNLEQGEVHYPFHPPLALNREDIAAGEALFCQAAPNEDLLIQVREIEAVRDIPVRLLPARVHKKERLAPNVMRLVLKLPKAQRLQFLAGQYIDILLPGGKRRAFSIASPPQIEDRVELHVRHVEGGDFTGFVFNELEERQILRLEGPLGTFFVRNDANRPMIMLGGGTGFAPLKAMIEDLLEHHDQRPIHLFWGVRNLAELYQAKLPQSWVEQYSHIQFNAVLSDAEKEDQWGGMTGFVHQAVIDLYPNLSNFDVYMSGPPAMIDAAKTAFADCRLPVDRLFYDSFEFGLDVPVKVLAKPH